MNNERELIEKLAIEHGITITHNGYAGETDLLNIETAEAFAKALQSSEPVAFINVEKRKLEWAKPTSFNTALCGSYPKIPLYDHPPVQSSEPVYLLPLGDERYETVKPENVDDLKQYTEVLTLFTHPPASVPLEKYNKLLDALKYIEGWSHQLIKEKKSSMVNDLIFVRAKQAIAEASQVEGKEG